MRKRLLVVGGTGYVGKAFVDYARSKDHFDVYTISRSGSGDKNIVADITDPNSLQWIFKPSDIVINLVGLSPLKKTKPSIYKKVHLGGVENLLEVFSSVAIEKFIHISALGSNLKSKIPYLSSKAEAENLITTSYICKYAIIKPSLILNEKSELFAMARLLDKLRIGLKIKSRVQPVVLDDFVEFLYKVVRSDIYNVKYEVGGNEIFTVGEILDMLGKNRKLLSVPTPLLKIGAYMSHYIPFIPFGVDQARFLEVDSLGDIRSFSYMQRTRSVSSCISNLK